MTEGFGRMFQHIEGLHVFGANLSQLRQWAYTLKSKVPVGSCCSRVDSHIRKDSSNPC